MPTRRTGLWLLAAAALGVRAAAVLALAGETSRPVTYEHGEIARNLVAGRGFTVTFLGGEGATSQQAPLYPMLLAGLYRCFGVESQEALLVLQFLQCAAGTALVLLAARLAWSLMPATPTIGWATGWGAALYPTHVYAVTHVQVAIWAALLLMLVMVLACEPRRAVAAGAAAGLMVLVEPILALALPAAAWMLWRRGRRWAPLGWMALAASLVTAPWLVRNYAVHGELVLVKSTFGYAFWQGNNPSSWGTDKIPKPDVEQIRQSHDGTLRGRHRALWLARHETLYIDDVLLKPGGYARFAGLSEPARSRLLGAEAWQYVLQEPAAYLGRCLRRLQYFLLWDQTNPKTAAWLYRAATLAWLVLLIGGLVRSRPWWPRLAPLMLIFAAVTVFHSLTIVSARFRIPLEPLSFVVIGFLARPRRSPPTMVPDGSGGPCACAHAGR